MCVHESYYVAVSDGRFYYSDDHMTSRMKCCPGNLQYFRDTEYPAVFISMPGLESGYGKSIHCGSGIP